MFQRAGYEAICVVDQADALAQLRTQSFGLLVLDVFIEARNTLDDLEVYREMAPQVPVAIMTAGQLDNPDAGATALNKARRARVNFLLPKPFFYDDVKQVCEDVDAFWTRSGADNSLSAAG
jgi:CheY-like chemotaxis protein